MSHRYDKPFACPECGSPSKRVVDSRPKGIGIRRRRECEKGHRFTTHERVIEDYDRIQRKQNEVELACVFLRHAADKLEQYNQ